MRLSEKHKKIIHNMERNDYVWLSNLSKNAIMRFRYKSKQGFTGYIKIEGLTFLTKRVAAAMEAGSKATARSRLTYREQIKFLEEQLVQLEQELYELKDIRLND